MSSALFIVSWAWKWSPLFSPLTIKRSYGQCIYFCAFKETPVTEVSFLLKINLEMAFYFLVLEITRFQEVQKSSNSEPLKGRSNEMKATAFNFKMTGWFDTEHLVCCVISVFYILWHYVQRVMWHVKNVSQWSGNSEEPNYAEYL